MTGRLETFVNSQKPRLRLAFAGYFPNAKRKRWAFLILALGSAALAAGCNRQAADAKTDGAGAAAKPQTLTVTLVKPVQKTVAGVVEQPGEIYAFEQTPLVAKISGYVLKVNKDIGDRVDESEVLVELSVPEMDEELKQKQALANQAAREVERAKKLAAAAEAHRLVAEAKVKEAKAARLRAVAEHQRAESQYERLKKSGSGVITPENIEESKLAFETAKANIAEVDAKIKSAEAAGVESESNRDATDAEIEVAQARVGVAQAAVRTSAELVKYAKLRAPYPGVVTRRHVDPGHFLQANAAKGEPVMVVARQDPVRVAVDVQENDAVRVAAGAKATVRVQALRGEEFPGTVTRTAWALDPKGRTLRAEIELKNPERRLRPGMYAFASIRLPPETGWTVPANALATVGGQSHCFVAVEGKARQYAVKVGWREGAAIEVRGRRAGGDGPWESWTGMENVIAPIPSGLADGQAVTASGNP